jgi:hypothetical protein
MGNCTLETKTNLNDLIHGKLDFCQNFRLKYFQPKAQCLNRVSSARLLDRHRDLGLQDVHYHRTDYFLGHHRDLG